MKSLLFIKYRTPIGVLLIAVLLSVFTLNAWGDENTATLSADFTKSNSSGGTSPDLFTASGGSTGSYYRLQKGSIISDNAYAVDPSQSISVKMKVGTFGSYSSGKQSVIFYAVNSSGTKISSDYTASFTKANSSGATFSGTITLNSEQTGEGVYFKFASSSSATSSVCARFYTLSITYTKPSQTGSKKTVD